MNMQIHPVANIFPLMGDREFAALCADIKEHGLRESIWLDRDGGSVIDGRHRLRACMREGIEPRFLTWDGTGSLVSFVVSLNLHRRHLDESQRALVAARIANLSEGRPSKTSPIGGVSQGEAANMLNVGKRSVERAREVLDSGTPELVAAVESGSMSVSLAAKVAELPEDDQQDIAILPKAEAVDEYKRRAHVANNSGNNEWYTPPQFIAAARAVMGSIDVDPASSPIANQTVGAHEYFTAEDDGLTREWRGNVWLNPPYAQPLISQFAEAVSDKYDAEEINSACILVNNATETAWFQRMLASATAVCFLRSRVKFLDPAGNASGAPLQGQVVIYMGAYVAEFTVAFSEMGTVLVKA